MCFLCFGKRLNDCFVLLVVVWFSGCNFVRGGVWAPHQFNCNCGRFILTRAHSYLIKSVRSSLSLYRSRLSSHPALFF